MPSSTDHALRPPEAGPRSLTRALGLASLGLGLPQLARPSAAARALGLPATGTTARLVAVVGARELVHAAGLLRPGAGGRWVRTRLVGDVLDLALLGTAVRTGRSTDPRRTLVAAGAVAAITGVDLLAARRPTVRLDDELVASTTVAVEPKAAYEFWRGLHRLPRFMAHVIDVQELDTTRSRWQVRGPFGRTVSWQAQITRDDPPHLICWRTTAGSRPAHLGEVCFRPAPGGQGCEVSVRISWSRPGGRLGRLVARVAGEDPRQQLDDDLRRFKQVLETGEVVRSDGAPGGKRARKEFPQRPARPLRPKEFARLRKEESA